MPTGTSDVPRLRTLGLATEYRSDEVNLAQALLMRCLAVSASYDRAVGYFTSDGLATAARGLEAFVAGGGMMRLIASPAFEEGDLQAIVDGTTAQADVIAQALLRELARGFGENTANRLAYLAWMVADGTLAIRVAIPTPPKHGIYHEKIGIFVDAWGDAIAIVGSANETRGGLLDNFESVDVFTSWSIDGERVLRKRRHFERLWANETEGLEVMEVPEAVRRELMRLAPERKPGKDLSEADESTEQDGDLVVLQPPSLGPMVRLPDGLALRDYQSEAIQRWWLNGRTGILAMATGTGKTVTALSAVRDVSQEESQPMCVAILAPYRHLVDQWCMEALRWGLRPIPCYESTNSWKASVDREVDLLRAGVRPVVTLVATHATASLEPFKDVLRRLPPDSLFLIADETHHLGSQGNEGTLPPNARFRLGLSATPERWEDEAGTQRLIAYFEGVVFEFDISDAIRSGCLTPYLYFPLLVDLEKDELEDYHEVANQIETELTKSPADRNGPRLKSLLARRTSLLNEAKGKIKALREEVAQMPLDRSLIYCSSRRQLAAVMDLLWSRGVVSRQFTGEENGDERRSLLRAIASGETPALVAIKCLDEGADVPDVRQAHILASSGNPREFIQRRGRLLRVAPGKVRASITDYVVVPEGRAEHDREIMRRELKRIGVFASAAENGAQALDRLWPTLDRFDLLGELGGS